MESGGGKKCAKKLGYPAGDPVGSQVPQEQSKSQSDSPQSGFGGGGIFAAGFGLRQGRNPRIVTRAQAESHPNA